MINIFDYLMMNLYKINYPILYVHANNIKSLNNCLIINNESPSNYTPNSNSKSILNL
jgi:hypothetical protein